MYSSTRVVSQAHPLDVIISPPLQLVLVSSPLFFLGCCTALTLSASAYLIKIDAGLPTWTQKSESVEATCVREVQQADLRDQLR